ncbi:MAG TPA: biotin/lipoyl-containing protein, partial [Solirubrobacteraceae bacterium]
MAVNTITQVTLPALGESVREGTVLEWHKREGDAVREGETLVEISTDKVDAEVPAPASGTLARIRVAAGETAAVGDVLAEIANGDAPPARDADDDGAPDEAGEVVDIVAPRGGESVTEGTILQWSVAVGDRVREGDTVVEISTDKVDMELGAPADGTIAEIVAPAGETVSVGEVIGRMRAGAPGFDRASASPAHDTAAPPAPDAVMPPVAANGSGTPPEHPAPISPVARRIAAAEGIDLAAVHGSGPAGRITKADVLSAKGAAPPPAAAPRP